MKDRATIVNDFKLANKSAEVARAKSKALEELEDLTDSEKEALTYLNKAVKTTDVKTIYRLLQIINLSKQ